MKRHLQSGWNNLFQSSKGALRPLIVASLITPCAFAIVDVNENGMSDLWEKQYNDGSLFGASFVPQGDEDGDGWSNGKEAVTGTNPKDGTPPAGFLTPQTTYEPSVWVDTDNDGIVDSQTVETAEITWLSLIGKQYQLFGSPDLMPGTWLEVDEPRMGTGGEIGLGIPLRQPDGSVPVRLFWRVAVRDVDTDGDTLTNYEEHQFGTNPNLPMTHPGIPDAWLVANFTNAQGFDPNGDPDGDGINNALENQLGLNPNHFDKTGPVNFGFDEIISESPDMSFRTAMFPLPSDLYDQTSIPGYNAESSEFTEGWQADTGSHIEIWKESGGIYSVTPPAPASQYVELQSRMEAHGVKQEFNMLPGTRLNFILCYKGRYAYDAYDNEFDLKVEGASEMLVDGSPVSATGTTRSKPFMNDDDWDKYTDWHYATISITAEAGSSGLKKITLSLVPKTTTAYGANGQEEITYGGFVDLVPVEIEQQDYITANGIRFCRWLDAFPNDIFDNTFADNDRDRFRIRIPAIIPNLTKIKIKSTDLNGAVVNGVVIAKTTDGDHEVGMKQENGAMVSEWLLLVSDGDDDVNYNGKGTDDGRDDQTLLADFQSGIVVTFPELGGGEVEFAAQKAIANITLDAWFLSPAGDVPQVFEEAIGRHIVKMQEIYRQIGIRMAWSSIGGLQVDQSWFNAVPASNEAANHLNQSECSSAMNKIKLQPIPQNHIRIGYVDATLKPSALDLFLSHGFTYGNSNGAIISLSLASDSRGMLGVSAHEVGHVLNLDHPESPPGQLLMKGSGFTWNNNKSDPKRFQIGDFVIIRNRYPYYVPN